jgi:flagellar basal-body rod protein FlgC
MSLFNIFDIAGSAVSAQSLRLNTTASNLANADSVASDPDSVYRARQPVFQAMSLPDGRAGAGMRMLGVVESTAPPNVRHDPKHDFGIALLSDECRSDQHVENLTAPHLELGSIGSLR